MIHRRFLSRLVNRPQMIAPAAGAAVLEALLPGSQLLGYSDPPANDARTDRDYQVSGTTAIIPVVGELCHRGSWMDAMSGVCSYQALGDMVVSAMSDPGVGSIILDVDSPGGEAAGCLDFAEWLAAQRGRKTIWAMINQTACSAAYAIASACDRVLIGTSGYAGSIGVVAYHTDLSAALDAAGIKVTYIFAGARKIDGAPELPLSPEARASFQAVVDAEYARFVQVVAGNRGMTPEAVMATEAAIYRGQDAVSAGLADEIATPEEALAAMSTTQTTTAPTGARLSAPAPGAVASGIGGPALAPAMPEPAATAAPLAAAQPATAPAPADSTPAAPHALAEACTKAGHPGLIAGLLQQGASMAAVQSRLADAKAITEAATSMGLASLGATLVGSGIGLDPARQVLFDAKASGDGALRTSPSHAGDQPKQAAKMDRRAIYARQNGLAPK